MPAPGEHHPAFEEYCECIFELAEDDVDIIQARIADRLLVSRPAVSEMIKRLEAEGLLTNDGAIVLTAAGHRARRASGAPPPARRALPHRRLEVVVGRSAPRGRQVGARHERPRRAGDGPAARQPHHLPARQPDPRLCLRRDRRRSRCRGIADRVRVHGGRIPEELEFTPGLLEFLEESSIQPGHVGVITAASPDGTMTVEIDGRHVGVGAFASDRILVTT